MMKMSLALKRAVPYALATLFLGSAGVIAAQRYVVSDCCSPGAACCHPGAPCCDGGVKTAER